MSKLLTYLVIHCTASPAGREVSFDDIKRIHLGPCKQTNGTIIYKGKTYKSIADLPDEKIGGVSIKKFTGRGWTRIGYSDLIHLDGRIENLTPYNDDNIVDPWEITNGASGINSISRHVVYAGGVDANDVKKAKDTRTAEQKQAMADYVIGTIARYPNILVAGHRQFANKACPSFDTVEWLRSIGIAEKNIYKGTFKK